MRHIKLFEEHLPTSGWQGDLPEYKTWWIELDESEQNRYCQEFFPDKCSSSNSKYFPNDQEIKYMWEENYVKEYPEAHDDVDHARSIRNEGKTYNDTKAGLFPKKPWDPNKKRDFLLTIKNHIKSKELTSKQIGNDLEIICDDKMIAQVMFRDKYVGVRAKGAKFTDEFEYTELGKIKAKISEIVKDCK